MRSGEVLSHLLIEILTGLFSEAPVLDDRLTGYPLHSDLPRNNERQVGSLAGGCPELFYCFHEVALLK